MPLYEKDEKWGRLPALYEVLLGHAEDRDEQLALLDKLVQVNGPPAAGPRGRVRVGAQGVRARARAREGALEAFEAAARARGAVAGLRRRR